MEAMEREVCDITGSVSWPGSPQDTGAAMLSTTRSTKSLPEAEGEKPMLRISHDDTSSSSSILRKSSMKRQRKIDRNLGL